MTPGVAAGKPSQETDRSGADVYASPWLSGWLFSVAGLVVAMVAVGVAMLVALMSRTDLEINALHDRNPLFVRLSDGGIRNGYTIKILNKQRMPRFFSLTVSGIPGATMRVVGQNAEAQAAVMLQAKPDRVAEYKLYLKAPRGAPRAKRTEINFLLTDSKTGQVARRASFFNGPGR